jgi:hypothetical protein
MPRHVDPVSCGIRDEGKVAYGGISFIIKSEEDAGASVRKDAMRRFGENVIV